MHSGLLFVIAMKQNKRSKKNTTYWKEIAFIFTKIGSIGVIQSFTRPNSAHPRASGGDVRKSNRPATNADLIMTKKPAGTKSSCKELP